MNLPNKLTIARVCLIPLFVAALQIGMAADFGFSLEVGRYIATAIFVIAAATDWLDGFLARKMNLVTDFGKFMDPLADKILVMAAMVYMVVLGDISAWVLILIESREFIIAGVRMVAANKNIVIAAGICGKLKTVTQMVMIPIVLLNIQNNVVQIIGQVLVFVAVGLTVISAIDYIWNNRKIFQGEMSA